MFPEPPYMGGIGDVLPRLRPTNNKVHILFVMRRDPQSRDCGVFVFDTNHPMLLFFFP